MTEFNINLADEHFTVHCSQPFTCKRFSGFEAEAGGEVLQNGPAMMKKYRLLLEEKRKINKNAGEKLLPNEYDFYAIFDLAAHALVPRGVLLMHGSTVVVDGQAVMFIAPSQTGKSTHTRLWTRLLGDRAFIINDDKPFVRLDRQPPLVYATPWGMVKPPPAVKSAPLRAVVWLQRGENHIEPFSRAEMLPKLMQSSLRGDTPQETVQIMQLQQSLLTSVSLWQMTCTPDIEAAKMAYAAIFEE